VSNDPCHGPVASVRGFSLIEVIAALVVFSMGVLMVLSLTTALSTRMQYSAVASELAVRSQERLDSLESLPFASLTVGTKVDTITVQGVQYVRTVVVTPVTGLLYELQVTLVRLDGGSGPSSTATSYAAAPW
jgi:prepilin-type N-terminal cleavage/methylation domain-containing protein